MEPIAIIMGLVCTLGLFPVAISYDLPEAGACLFMGALFIIPIKFKKR